MIHLQLISSLCFRIPFSGTDVSKSSGWDTGGPFLAPLISVSSPCRSPLRTGDGAAESLRGCGDRTSTQPPRSPAQYPRTPLSETHSYKHSYKTFECGLFHAGARPPAFLSSKDIFCGQLGDESQREKNGNKVKGGGDGDPARFQSAFSENLWWRLLVCSSRWLFLDPPGRAA